MLMYLSSYYFGDRKEEFRAMLGRTNGRIAVSCNALDFRPPEEIDYDRHVEPLTALGATVEIIDFRDYFGAPERLAARIDQLGGLWISGGNVFVLRQAMKHSGLDEILLSMKRDDFLYAGFSAACCVLSPRLDCYQIVDDPTLTPYEDKTVVWEGLNLLEFAPMPHFDSDHPESEDIAKEVAYCEEHGIPYKTMRDGDVLVIE